MFTEIQKQYILAAALKTFANQKGVTLDPADFDIMLDAPNFRSLCSVKIQTKRTDDAFQMKLYIAEFTNITDVGRFSLLQEESHAPGLGDEVWVATARLDKRQFGSVFAYIMSPAFATLLNSSNYVQLAESTGRIVLASGAGFLTYEKLPVA